MYEKILHAQDGSAGAFEALAEAIELAKRYGTELRTISVEEIPHYGGSVGEVIDEQDWEEHRFREAGDKEQGAGAGGGYRDQPAHPRRA